MRKCMNLLVLIAMLVNCSRVEAREPKSAVWLYESDGIPFVSIVGDKAIGWYSTKGRVLLGQLEPGDVVQADAILRSSWTDPDVYGRSCYDLRLALLDMQGNDLGEITGSHRAGICEELEDKVVLLGARRIVKPGMYQVAIQVGATFGGIDLYGSAALRATVIPKPTR